MTYEQTREKYAQYLSSRLSAPRLYHSECVARSARQLAEKYGGDPEKMYIAGLLHDVTKEAGAAETALICGRYGVEFTPLEAASPKLWHQKTGAACVRFELGITDDDILLPIMYHTTGRAGMTLGEKILFTADFISADRDYPDLDVIRAKAERSLEEAMIYGLAYTIRELAESERAVHPDTVEIYNELILNAEN